jgi:SAM-dependent methyltransferase
MSRSLPDRQLCLPARTGGTIVSGMAHHELPDDVTELFTPEFWDARYASADSIWSGNPNPLLVELVAPREPGSALDVGSGEGADAIWLATRGWQVVGADISQVALDRAATRASEFGEQLSRRISWQQIDLLASLAIPEPKKFDLVSAQFMQVPADRRESLHRALAESVRPGGMLLVVGHHPCDLEVTGRPAHLQNFMFTADQVAAVLDPPSWQIMVQGSPAREARDTDGSPMTVHDAVLSAVRLT